MSDVSPQRGLSSAEAAASLDEHGYNELPSSVRRSLGAIAWEVVREPMFMLLIGGSVVYLLLGDIREALVLFASVFVVMGITFHQERKTERALEALRELSSPRTLVLRDGEWRTVPGREVVPGDLVRVKEGDRVPADATLVDGRNVTADESLLTGESIPVRKRVSDTVPAQPGGDDSPGLYSGTLITQGQGIGRVSATGARTQIGRIGRSLQTLTPEVSPLQREMRRAVFIFSAIGLASCAVVIVLYAITRGDWLNGVLAGITLAMANVPEEFPVILTVFLALGAWRISQQGVLTRRAPAIETLGSTTVLCVDKTGTLTRNSMEVKSLWAPEHDSGDADSLAERTAGLIEWSVLASERDPFDPMEKAYHLLLRQRAPHMAAKIGGWTLVREYPLSPGQLSVAYIWRPESGDRHVVAAKGAPEAIVNLCTLDASERDAVLRQAAAMANDGLRVLAVAHATASPTAGSSDGWPATQAGLQLRFAGLTGLADPTRPSVPAALRDCYAAGIRTVMITGDYPNTAQAIARQIGFARPEIVTTGAGLEAMKSAALRDCVARTDIFARVTPAQKLRLVEALKANGEIVAMTGDGVNDAPALKAAHIGVAMGGRGSDVAREAASLVLVNDDFATLVEAVRIGRRIYDNIRKATSYIIAVHIPTAGLSLLPLLFGWPLVFYPIHIVFLELVIDPACSIAFEAEAPEANVMRRPPRPAAGLLFTPRIVAASVAQGTTVLVAVTVLYAMTLSAGTAEPVARAMAFVAVVLGNLGLILTNRSLSEPVLATLRRPNPALGWIAGLTIGGLALALYVMPVRDIFRFEAPSPLQLGLSALAALAALALLEAGKALWPVSRGITAARRQRN